MFIGAYVSYAFLASRLKTKPTLDFVLAKIWRGAIKKEREVNRMIVELIITFIIIVAGCLLLLQLYDFFESETVRMLLVIAYGLFTVFMLFYWLFEYALYQLKL